MLRFAVALVLAVDTPDTDSIIRAACPETASAQELVRRERALGQRARDGDFAENHSLACTRARLYLGGMIARQGWLMPSGTSWHVGALRVALHGLEHDSANARFAELLGALLLADRAELLHEEAATALESAVTHGARGTAAMRSCAALARELGRPGSAARCDTTALVSGVDSAWHLIHLARLAFSEADTVAGRRLFDGALTSARNDADWTVVRWHLRWFLDPDESVGWDSLPDPARAAWVRDRLAVRDLRDGRAPGSRLAEHFRRLETVDSLFRYRLSRQDLARLRYAADPESQLPREHIYKYWEPGVVPAEPFRVYRGIYPEYDDRAAVWMRFGPPTKRVRWTTTDKSANRAERYGDPPLIASLPLVPASNVREAWTYEVDGETLVLSFEGERFDGTTEATRLVVGVLGSYLCDVDSWRCNLTMRASATGMPPLEVEHIATLRESDREHLVQATTRDDHGIRAARTIRPIARIHRVWDPRSGRVLGVVPWAIPTRDVAGGRDTTTTFTLTVRQWDPATGAWLEAAIPRALRLPRDRSRDGYLTGHAVVASTAGVSAWSVVTVQDTTGWGRAWADHVAPLGGGALSLSDVVLGAVSQGQSWTTSGGTTVPLAPLGAFDRKEPVTLYWQVKSTLSREQLRTTVAFYKVEADGTEPALQISYSGPVAAGLNEELREVDIGRLDGGRYRIEVRVTDPVNGNTIRHGAELLVK
ncbi:MAG: hypothetical protein U0974_16500 [Gemmatimonadales bacterium]|nr:hypothetical protein [Gemmatimonadales bacterium]MDZ4391327.1 hypothetical protein [Gemmatimonadales bacterium]